jgi:hypothetical protein
MFDNCSDCYSYEESYILELNKGICETCRVEGI